MLFSKFEVHSFKETKDGFKLKATVWGEKFKADKHPQKVGVKAATYHQMEIIREENKTTLIFILDI